MAPGSEALEVSLKVCKEENWEVLQKKSSFSEPGGPLQGPPGGCIPAQLLPLLRSSSPLRARSISSTNCSKTRT